MAGQIHILNYGTDEKSKEVLNTPVYAAKLADGLKRIAAMLVDPETKFVELSAFKPGDPDNTQVHFSMLTDVFLADVVSSPLQFNAHLMIKYISSTDEFASGLTTAVALPVGEEIETK